MRNAEGLKNRGGLRRALGLGQMLEAVLDIFFDRQMREQGEALKYVAYATLRYWHIDALRGIEQDAVADGDASGVGGGEAGDAIEQSGFAGAGGAEEDGESGRGLERGFQDEIMGLRCVALAKTGFELWPGSSLRAL
jgi:hypothetical protein